MAQPSEVQMMSSGEHFPPTDGPALAEASTPDCAAAHVSAFLSECRMKRVYSLLLTDCWELESAAAAVTAAPEEHR